MATLIDNELYNRPGDIWWDEGEVLNLLRTAINPARVGYFRRVLMNELRIDVAGKAVLDIGCGGGILAEEFARLGCRVTGVDPSESSLETARQHARQSGLEIDYRQGVGESLPFPDASFDIVYCCDVLEHVSDLDRVMAETVRVLKPRGIYLYDTINRTPISKLVMIRLFQEWSWSSITPPRLHVWQMFIKPGELKAALARHGLEHRDLRGMKPRANPIQLVRMLRAIKRGKMELAHLGRRGGFRESRDTSVSYMGYGVRSA